MGNIIDPDQTASYLVYTVCLNSLGENTACFRDILYGSVLVPGEKIFKSYVGDSKSYVGDNNSYVGVSNSYVGDNKSYVGDSNSYVGDNKSYVGVTNTYVGVSNSYVGDNVLRRR